MARPLYEFGELNWWDALKTDEEKNEYCKEVFKMTYEDYLEIINSDRPIKEMILEMQAKYPDGVK